MGLFRIDHEEPGAFCGNYVLLPYGYYYYHTKPLLDAKEGDVMRFFNGRDAIIRSVCLVEGAGVCDALCRFRYGVPWSAAFARWVRYAVMQGNARGVLDPGKCIMIMFEYQCEEKQ